MIRRMSVRTTTERICDVCGKPADCYRVSYPPARTRTFDLCDRHAAPLLKLDETIPPHRGGAPARRVVSQADVDKEARRNKAARAKKKPPT